MLDVVLTLIGFLLLLALQHRLLLHRLLLQSSRLAIKQYSLLILLLNIRLLLLLLLIVCLLRLLLLLKSAGTIDIAAVKILLVDILELPPSPAEARELFLGVLFELAIAAVGIQKLLFKGGVSVA